MWRFLILIVVTTTLVFSPGTDAADKKKKRDTLYSNIYRDIDDMGYCVRLTNADQSIGCATGPNGDTGTVYLIESQRDIDWVLSEGSMPPYVPLINQKQFYNRTFMMLLKDGAAAGRISGIIADFLTSTNDYQQDNGESPARQCPNQGFGGIGSTCNPTWNPKGSSLAFDHFDFPIFGLRDPEQLGALKNCSILFNQKNSSFERSYPACQVRMRAFMSASVNTPTCMRKNSHVILSSSGFCDPLVNPSFWGSLFSPTKINKSEAVVMATAKMDASAFFHQLSFGANNNAAGIVALLGALEALGKLKRDHKISENSISKPILFVFFNGEEWDYIGSSRMVYNLLKNCQKDSQKGCEVGDGEVPISRFLGLNRIESFLELSQIGLPGEGGTLFGHKPSNANATKLFNTLTSYSSAISPAPDGQQLPPSSLLQFLDELNVIGGVVLADHSGSYKNRFYGGAFDDAHNLHLNADQTTSSHLADVSTTVAKTLLNLAGANDSVIDMVKANETTISTLLHCFLQEMNCTLFKNLSTSDDADKLKNRAGPRYISVDASTPNAVTLIRKLAIYYSGIEATGTKQDDCTNGPVSESKSGKSNYLKTMVWNRGAGFCRYGYVYKTEAKSPAFLLKEYGSSKYSTWAESRWDVDPTLSFYVASSDYIENVTLGVGVMMFVLSFFGTWYGMRRMNSRSGEYTVQ
ncbi:nicastrin-like [Oscarella lobularis]|uniref:nicastrin-like n=1 Tax=Oscarella lobularis TaxID=121494 RepID=UPI00331347BA